MLVPLGMTVSLDVCEKDMHMLRKAANCVVHVLVMMSCTSEVVWGNNKHQQGTRSQGE